MKNKKNIIILICGVIIIALFITIFALSNKHDVNTIDKTNLSVVINGETVDAVGSIKNNEITIDGKAFGMDGTYNLVQIEKMGYTVTYDSIRNDGTVYITKNTDEPGTSPDIPEEPEDAPKAGVLELDMMDINNGEWLDTNDGKKEIYFGSLPEGTLLQHKDLVYDSTDTIENNVLNFAEILHVFDRGLKYDSESKFMDVNGDKDIIIDVTDDGKGVVIGVVPTFGCVYPGIDSNFAPVGDRLMILNSMAFFGDKDMAKAVYGLITEHYFYRNDNDKIITDELAGKYGLTIKHTEEYMTDFKEAEATVSNGSQTWTIRYSTANKYVASGFSVEIYK